MTKADLVERVTAQISRTAGPMISKKDCARVVDSYNGLASATRVAEKDKATTTRRVQHLHGLFRRVQTEIPKRGPRHRILGKGGNDK